MTLIFLYERILITSVLDSVRKCKKKQSLFFYSIALHSLILRHRHTTPQTYYVMSILRHNLTTVKGLVRDDNTGQRWREFTVP
jgi:hypothetical protein